MSRILIVKTSALGDIVQTFFAVDRLKITYPEIVVDWVVESSCAALLQVYPHVHRTISVDTKGWRKSPFSCKTWREVRAYVEQVRSCEYETVLDLQGNIKSGVLTALARSNQKVGWGGSSLPEWPNALFTHRRVNPPSRYSARERYRFFLEAVFGALRKEPETVRPPLKKEACFLVAPGSRWENKKLALDCWVGLLHRMAERLEGRFLLIWGTESEKLECIAIQRQLPHCAEVLEYFSIPQLPELFRRVDGFLGVDSFLLHFAAYLGVPTYSIFGASSSAQYAPVGPQHQTVQGSCPYGKKFEKRCPLLRTCITGDCMKKWNPEVLYRHFFVTTAVQDEFA